ncbi:Dipeptidyl peptidase 4 [Oopsacas minuta]|uniref:Dipeptidyl peptidase 4 n=1 Tax=Oopsacas minuta TaxID=111878 RepID=A0AAV7JPB5_9METZ|nr:Dipeptidyl peptidase 4 [Oopsacas minuta]
MEEHSPFMQQKKKDKNNSCKLLIIFVCVLLIVLVVCLIAVGIGVLVHFLLKPNDLGTPISLQDILNTSFHAQLFSGSWASDDQLISISPNGLELLNVTDNTTSVLVNATFWEELEIDYWFISPSQSYLLLAHNSNKLYRYSYTADYSILQLSSMNNYIIPGSQWRVVKWTHTDQLVLANQSAMYFISDVTTSQIPDIIILYSNNLGEIAGFPDWVYEEEILSTGSCVYPSDVTDPVLAFLVFNTTGVPEATIIEYGAEIGPYPSYTLIPYPKSGDTESTVKLMLVDTTNSTTCSIPMPTGYHYIQGVDWKDTTHVSVRFLNRLQTDMTLSLYDTTCTLVSTVHTYQTEGWVEASILAPYFLSNGDVITLLPQDAYTQIVKISNGVVTSVTSGNEVRSITAVYNSELVFYTTAEYSYKTHLYLVSLTDITQVICVSCDVSNQLTNTELENRDCEVVSTSFSQDSRYFLLNCLGPDTPFSILLDYSLKLLLVLHNNTALERTLSTYSLPVVKPYEFKDKSQSFYGTKMIPKDFDFSNSYPVLLYVYGGPNSNLASLSHPLYPFSGFIAHLVSSLGFVVITVEGSGTCCRGQDFRFAVKNRLGVLEARDQASLSNYLLSQSWVRSVSIMGSSYGGYLSGMTSSEKDNSLSAAIVISPVTDWRYYDSVYTQRYMNTPQNNPQGYNDSSLLLRAGNIDGSKLLLIHGSADDNVHYQNSAELSLSLKREKQSSRMHTYFNENHHLRKEGTREDLYKLLESFLVEKSV